MQMKQQSIGKKMSYSSIKKKLFTEISKKDFDDIFKNQSYIGSGMQGEVYKASYKDTLVAIKYFRKQFIGMDYISYIQSEIQTLSEIRNENILSFIDSYQVIMGSHYSQKKYCIVTEYCRQSLQSYHFISQLDNITKLRMCLQLISGVKAAHEKGIIHRDIKPQNILIKDLETLTIKLADFGCCRIGTQEDVTMTKNVGTPLYADPNIQNGRYSKKCDVYSVGLVICYIFCGKQYFSHCDSREKLMEAKRKFCKNTEKQTRSFLRNYDLQEDIQEFLINIAFYTLSDNQQKRFSSEQLYNQVEKGIKCYEKQHMKKSAISSSSISSSDQDNSEQSEFQQTQIKPEIKFTKPQKDQNTQQNSDQHRHFYSPFAQIESPLSNDPSNQSYDRLSQSQLSQAKSKETTDRLTEEPKSSQKSSYEENNVNSICYESDSFYSSQNQDFNRRSNGEIISHNALKVEEKVNQSQFIKKSCFNDEEEQNTNSKMRSKYQNASRVSTQKYNSTLLASRSQSFYKEKPKLDQRKESLENHSKVLSDSEQICAQIIKYGTQCQVILDQCEANTSLLKLLQEIKLSFQQIKKIEEVHSYSLTFEQKQVIAFFFHCLYVSQMKNFILGSAPKLCYLLGKITEQSRQFINSLIMKETQKIFKNLKKYAVDLNRKAGLIKPRLSKQVVNLVNEVVMCGNGQSLFGVNLNLKIIQNEACNFIDEKLREVKKQDDRLIIEGLRNEIEFDDKLKRFY